MHQSNRFPKYKVPQYSKKVTNELLVSLSYVPGPSQDVLLSFHNTLRTKIIVNPIPENDLDKKPTSGWFGSVFGTSKGNSEDTQPLNDHSTDENAPINLFLGYIQLVGYVVLNYKLQFNDASFIDLGANGNFSWWKDKDYAEKYSNDDVIELVDDHLSRLHNGLSSVPESTTSGPALALALALTPTVDDNEENDAEGSFEEKLDKVPFIALSLKDRMVIGGKVGGLNDLYVGNENEPIRPENNGSIKSLLNKLYNLHDLAFGFNSMKYPDPKNGSEEHNESTSFLHEQISDLTKAILPFYVTSQSLIFTDLTLLPQETKTFYILLSDSKHMAPSYNHRLTGLTGDQGLVSIRYLLVIGLLEMQESGNLESRSLYFPYEVVTSPIGSMYALPDYLQRTVINYNWKAAVEPENYVEKDKDKPRGTEIESKFEDIRDNQQVDTKLVDTKLKSLEITSSNEIIEKETFLQDLKQLIEADLHNIPKVSSLERRGSAISQADLTLDTNIFSPQISLNHKTQFQITLNLNLICIVHVVKPYFNAGDDINYVIELKYDKNVAPRIVGTIVQLEATERYSYIKRANLIKSLAHTYKVSSSIKKNLFAPAMFNKEITYINGAINIPKHLTPQFQSSRLMKLSYSLVFKFNYLDFDLETSSLPLTENLSTNGSTEESSNQDSNSNQESLETTQNVKQEPTLDKYKKYQVNDEGNEFSFKLPIVIV